MPVRADRARRPGTVRPVGREGRCHLAARGAMDPRYQCLGLGPAWSWRLLGSNHRALARTTGTFASMEEAAADALWTGGLAAHAEIEIVTSRGATWRWELSVQGALRVTSAVFYARRLECVRAVARYRECAPLAGVSPVPLVRRPGSGRAWRGPSPAGGREPGDDGAQLPPAG